MAKQTPKTVKVAKPERKSAGRREKPDTLAKCRRVMTMMENGSSENHACSAVGLCRGTFRAAVLRHEIADDYARACNILAKDQIEKLEVAIDDMRGGVIDAQMARVEIDARKWFASKFAPRLFGDKLELGGSMTLHHDVADMSPADRVAEIKKLIELHPELGTVMKNQ